eukprot:1925521-Pyramimonas_sp.AAC.1
METLPVAREDASPKCLWLPGLIHHSELYRVPVHLGQVPARITAALLSSKYMHNASRSHCRHFIARLCYACVSQPVCAVATSTFSIFYRTQKGIFISTFNATSNVTSNVTANVTSNVDTHQISFSLAPSDATPMACTRSQ